MTNEERPLYEIVEKLEAAWNTSDSVAWAVAFCRGRRLHSHSGRTFPRTRPRLERGHRTIFDTIYKGSRNSFKVEKVRFVRPDVALVFIRRQPHVVPERRRAAPSGASHAGGAEERHWSMGDCRLPEHADYARRSGARCGEKADGGASVQRRYAGELIRGWKRHRCKRRGRQRDRWRRRASARRTTAPAYSALAVPGRSSWF